MVDREADGSDSLVRASARGHHGTMGLWDNREHFHNMELMG